jgi:hypothetical protein
MRCLKISIFRSSTQSIERTVPRAIASKTLVKARTLSFITKRISSVYYGVGIFDCFILTRTTLFIPSYKKE